MRNFLTITGGGPRQSRGSAARVPGTRATDVGRLTATEALRPGVESLERGLRGCLVGTEVIAIGELGTAVRALPDRVRSI